MNRGIFGFPVGSRIKYYESDPTTLTLAAVMVFHHGFGHYPTDSGVYLRCAVANNGYVEGDEIPIAFLTQETGGDDDGGPRYSWWVNVNEVRVYIPSGSTELQTSTGVSTGTFTSTQWKLMVRCSDNYPRP